MVENFNTTNNQCPRWGHFEKRVAVVDVKELSCTRWQDNRAVTLLACFPASLEQNLLQVHQGIIVKKKSDVRYHALQWPPSTNAWEPFTFQTPSSPFTVPTWSRRDYSRGSLHILDLMVVNAWLLYKRNIMNKCDQYTGRLLLLAEFKMDLAVSLRKTGKTVLKKQGRPGNQSVQQASSG